MTLETLSVRLIPDPIKTSSSIGRREACGLPNPGPLYHKARVDKTTFRAPASLKEACSLVHIVHNPVDAHSPPTGSPQAHPQLKMGAYKEEQIPSSELARHYYCY